MRRESTHEPRPPTQAALGGDHRRVGQQGADRRGSGRSAQARGLCEDLSGQSEERNCPGSDRLQRHRERARTSRSGDRRGFGRGDAADARTLPRAGDPGGDGLCLGLRRNQRGRGTGQAGCAGLLCPSFGDEGRRPQLHGQRQLHRRHLHDLRPIVPARRSRGQHRAADPKRQHVRHRVPHGATRRRDFQPRHQHRQRSVGRFQRLPRISRRRRRHPRRRLLHRGAARRAQVPCRRRAVSRGGKAAGGLQGRGLRKGRGSDTVAHRRACRRQCGL